MADETDLSKPPELCDAESCGYRCDREKGHGALHHHPEPGALGHDDWWLYWPHSEGEKVDMSGRPWTGYLLIADVALPLSKDSGVVIDSDIRFLELSVEQMYRRLAARGWVHQPDGGFLAVMCERCNVLGCPGSCEPMLTVAQANQQQEDYDSDDGSGYT